MARKRTRLFTVLFKGFLTSVLISASSFASPPVGKPEGVNDFYILDINSTATLNVIGNDLINGSTAPLRIGAVSGVVAASPCTTCGSWTSYDAVNFYFQTNTSLGDALFYYYAEDDNGDFEFGTCDGYPFPSVSADDSCAIVTVTVTYIADVPNLAVNSTVVMDENTSASLGISASISDIDGSETLTVSLSGLPAGAQITDGVLTSTTGVTDISSWDLGNIVVQPALDDDADFTLTVTATSTTPNLDTAQISNSIAVTVNQVNTPPVGIADVYSLDEGASLTVVVPGVLINDSDLEGDPLTVSLVSGPSYSSSFTLNPSGGFTYKHDDTENFADGFTYSIYDGDLTSATVKVSFTINHIDDNSPIVAGTYTGAITEGDILDPPATVTGSLSISDVDVDDSPVFNDVVIAGTYGAISLVSGTWVYTLDQNTVQSLAAGVVVTDELTLTASEGTSQDIVVTITGANDAPVVNDQNITISENLDQDTLVATLVASDIDADDSLTFNIISGLGTPVEFKINASGELRVGDHTPDIELLDFEDTPVYTLVVQVTDILGLTDTATIVVNLSDADDPPGTTVCEEFDGGGVALDVLPAYLDPIKVFYTFTPSDPCHRVIDVTDDYYMEQSKKLVAISPIPSPADTALVNYRISLNDISKNWDQDSSTLHFTKKQNVTGYLATVAFTDEAGAVTVSGEFVYQPPASLNATDDGIDNFVYRVCDDPVDESEAHCAFGVVYVNISKTAASSVVINNLVAGSEQLSQGPLELPVPALPNVFVLLDDSASMSSDILTTESEGYYAVGSKTKTYFLPEDGSGKSTYADTEANDPGKGLWRLRNAEFNKVYYNPGVSYYPWIGVDDGNDEFLNADPTAAISNPYKNTSARIDLTSTVNMPNNDRNVYLARHYIWTDINDVSCPANVAGIVDGDSPYSSPGGPCTEGTLVEIKPASAGGSDTYPKGTNRTDCANASYCTYAEEIQNFANFYSYSRTRHYTSKNSLGAVIAAAENMRIGFGAFGGKNDNINIEEMNESALAGNKGELLERIYRNNASSVSTPIRDSLEQTGRYYECLSSRTIIASGSTCPVLPAPEGNCQQNFSLVVTAGFWNASGPSGDIGNDDRGSSSAFDGGRYADTADQTLADVAMYFYERDLHPGLANEVPATQRDLDGAAASAFGGSSEMPTMHQHMSTYVISFGVSGTIDMADVPADYTASFAWGDALTDDEKLNDLVHTSVNGRGDYLNANNPEELKTALESAFQQFAQAIGTASAVSFNSQEIQAGSLVFRAFYNVRQNTGDLIAQNFNADGSLGSEVWSAAEQLDLKDHDDREILTFDSSVTNGAGGIPFRAGSLSSEQKLALEDDPLDIMAEGSVEFNAQIEKHVNYLRGDASNERPLGNLRERPEVDGRMGDIVSSTPVFYGPPNRTRRNSPPYPYSEPYETFKADHASRKDMVYVSSNDGMVHGFDANDGEEIFAFMPDHIITGDYSQKVKQLLSTNYAHRYSVDLSNSINDVYLDPDRRSNTSVTDKEWMTVLIGGYRAGAKGYFALDITDPDDVTELKADDVVMWEFTDEDDVHPVDGSGDPLLDAAGFPISDLGHSYSPPIIAMSNVSDPADDENEWVAILGNGYNSTSGKAVLYILYIGKGTDGEWCHEDKTGCSAGENDFIKIETPAVSSTVANGLGVPRAIDMDGNGTVDIVYAGDRFGNLYRFDLRDPDPDNWDATLLFQATYYNPSTLLNEAQPITTRPLVVAHPTEDTGANCYTFNEMEQQVDHLCGGYIVVFATGSYIYEGDDTTQDIQSLYGIWDRLGATLITKSDLVQQEYTAIEGDANVGDVRILSENPVDYSTKSGWYNDLDYASANGLIDPEHPGEKAIRNIQIRGGYVFVNSVMPKLAMSCTVEAGGAANTFCPDTGSLLCVEGNGVFDINGDGLINDGDLTESGDIVASTYFEDSVPTDSTFIGGDRVTQLSDRTLEIRKTATSGGANTGRISWSRIKRN